jgi:hypothetical protein
MSFDGHVLCQRIVVGPWALATLGAATAAADVATAAALRKLRRVARVRTTGDLAGDSGVNFDMAVSLSRFLWQYMVALMWQYTERRCVAHFFRTRIRPFLGPGLHLGARLAISRCRGQLTTLTFFHVADSRP